jgi:L-fuconolactonase
MRIDAHQHFWRYDAARDGWITGEMSAIRRDFLPPDLQGELSQHGFGGCVAVEAAPSLDQTRFLTGLAREHSFIKGVVGWVDILARDLEVTLEQLCRDRVLVGVRYGAQGEADGFLARDDVVRGIGCLGRFGLTFDILVYARQLPAALALVERLPGQRFVLDHIAKPAIRDGVLEPWATHIRALARQPNVWCKVSGLVTEADWSSWRIQDLAPYLDVVFEAFGATRLMFGSDWPVCLVAAEYAQVLTAVEAYAVQCDAAGRAELFGGTAARFYRLSE